jgi:hypothetical protein
VEAAYSAGPRPANWPLEAQEEIRLAPGIPLTAGLLAKADQLFTSQPAIEFSSRFRFPCIPRMSIKSKDFHSGGYNGGYRKPDR